MYVYFVKEVYGTCITRVRYKSMNYVKEEYLKCRICTIIEVYSIVHIHCDRVVRYRACNRYSNTNRALWYMHIPHVEYILGVEVYSTCRVFAM